MSELTRDQLTETAGEMRDRIKAAWGAPERWVPQSNPASLVGHPCPFFLWSLRARPNDLPEPWDGLPGIFKLGKEVERAVVRDLEDAGYEITHEQVRFRDEELDITGLIDGYIRQRNHPVLDRPVPLEIKGISGNLYEESTSFERLLAASYWRMRLIPAQLLMYAHLAPEQHRFVCLVPRNKNNRQTDPVLEFTHDWQHIIDHVHARLRLVNEALDTANPSGPLAMKYDPTFCDACDAKAICPTMERLQGRGNIRHMVSGELDAMCETFLARKADQSEFNRAKARIKKYAEGIGLYEPADVGTVATVVTNTHRVSVTHKTNGRFLDIVPLTDENTDDEEVRDGA